MEVLDLDKYDKFDLLARSAGYLAKISGDKPIYDVDTDRTIARVGISDGNELLFFLDGYNPGTGEGVLGAVSHCNRASCSFAHISFDPESNEIVASTIDNQGIFVGAKIEPNIDRLLRVIDGLIISKGL